MPAATEATLARAKEAAMTLRTPYCRASFPENQAESSTAWLAEIMTPPTFFGRPLSTTISGP
mgnify:CR=1 FL=1